ncbi:tetratricopeptide repeat protein [Tenacibaculum sp.]|nr:tetratricopeptide repeat protein [Tenacibaculum sp.]
MIFIIKLWIYTSLIRPFTILIHELGHGITALLLTKEKVTLHIGSYGNSKKSFRISFGRLEIFFLREYPFYYNIGLCTMHDKNISNTKQFIVVLFGPITSLIIAILLSYLVFFTNISDDSKLFLFITMISSLYDFYLNIIPRKEIITLNNNCTTYNDGQQLINLFDSRKFYKDYNYAADFYDHKDYEQASKQFIKIIESGVDYDYVYRLTVSSLLFSRDYKNAKLYNTIFEEKYIEKFNSNDFSNAGLIKSKLENHKDALIDYNRSLEINPDNTYSLNNRGYTYNLISEYKKAILDFNKAIDMEPNFAYAYNNRGLAKIKLGNVEDGLRDIQKSMDLDINNSYAYMNLGIYNFDILNYKEALINYEKALELDEETYLIDKRIEEVKLKLGIT